MVPRKAPPRVCCPAASKQPCVASREASSEDDTPLPKVPAPTSKPHGGKKVATPVLAPEPGNTVGALPDMHAPKSGWQPLPKPVKDSPPPGWIFVAGIGFFSVCFLVTSLGGQLSPKRLRDSPFTIHTEGASAYQATAPESPPNGEAGEPSGLTWASVSRTDGRETGTRTRTDTGTDTLTGMVTDIKGDKTTSAVTETGISMVIGMGTRT
ncbi:hypothetical protein P4O66_000642 [Electrophorus voltai]|uniref:Uncharacterized protein n=1 Tax=Electrophorus voltai TaxID=2609070 RepID=A0AAD8ZER1_9TELE|nr:hypothetical protein P4O66_000642 [Electrophorus voltai]